MMRFNGKIKGLDDAIKLVQRVQRKASEALRHDDAECIGRDSPLVTVLAMTVKLIAEINAWKDSLNDEA